MPFQPRTLLQQLQDHSEVLLLQVRHCQQVAHLTHGLARAPHLVTVGAEKVLAQNKAALHALERLQVLALRARQGLE